MLTSYEILIKLEQSKTYLRLIIVLYFLSISLIIYSSTYWLIQIGLMVFLLSGLPAEYIHQNPCRPIKEIRCYSNQWFLIMDDGIMQPYNEAKILIHNALFQLIKLSNTNKNKLIVVFNDQIPKMQLRMLHLKTMQDNKGSS